MEKKALTTSQGIWQYAVGNTGKNALLFIHGASSSKNIWLKQYDIDVEGYKNIFVDLLGYGASDKPNTGYSLSVWIKGINLILANEDIEQVCIIAHSNGVIFAKEYYRSFPDKVSSLILLDGMLKPMIDDQTLQWMKSTLERSDYRSFMDKNINNMVVEGLDEKDIEILKKDAINTPKAVSRAEFELVSNGATWEDLVIGCTTVIIHANSPFWTNDYVSWLQTMAPNHRFIEWNDSGHFIQMQYPDRLNELIHEVINTL